MSGLGTFLVRKPPFQIISLASFLFFVLGLLTVKHLFASLKKILLSISQSTTLARVLLDSGVVT